ncbi:MAG: hypothetical protein OHK0026_01310 [Rhodocyclaceae bacterium]
MSAVTRCLLAAAAAACANASAQDFRSLAAPALMYDAPSAQATPRFVIARATPVEVIVSIEGWAKVRDASGGLAWVARGKLSERRTLIVIAERAEVRSDPSEGAAAVFIAERDVVLDYVEAGPPGWVRVRHRDGQTGFVRVTQVWGT